MPKSTKSRAAASRRSSSGGHVRVVCPQCGRRVNVPASLGLGQLSYPCPSCRVPIHRSLIEAAKQADTPEAPPEPTSDN